MRELDLNTVDHAHILIGAEGYDVYSWSPEPAGTGAKCTQVHLALPPVERVRFVLRLKSARALDELVAVLLQHRADVWGPR